MLCDNHGFYNQPGLISSVRFERYNHLSVSTRFPTC